MSLINSIRSILGFGSDYNQVHSMELLSEFDIHLDNELELFQYQVLNQFKALSESNDDEFLSLNWLCNLLDAFIVCQQDFNTLLTKHKVDFTKRPLHKPLKEFLNTSIKSLDICNTVCYGIEKMQCWHKYLEIVSDALNSQHKNVICEWQFRRAKKALSDLSNIMYMYDDSKDSRLFFKSKDLNHHKGLSKSLSSSWSTSKQLQSMAKSLIPPQSHATIATNALANVVFTMGFVHLFVLWALMAAIPSQDRCFNIKFSIPKRFIWSTTFSVIYVRIMDEFKKRDNKNNVWLLKENYKMDKSIRFITNLVDSSCKFPLTEEQRAKVEFGVSEVELVSDAYKNRLHRLECQVRLGFHEIMSCRVEGLEILGRR